MCVVYYSLFVVCRLLLCVVVRCSVLFGEMYGVVVVCGLLLFAVRCVCHVVC